MSGSGRINIAGLLCSSASSAVILGGIAWGLVVSQAPHSTGATSRPLIFKLIPRKGSDADAKIVTASRDPGAVDAAITRPAMTSAPARPGAARPVSAPAFIETAAASTAEAKSPGAIDAGLLNDYQRRLNELITLNARYPGDARRLRLAGATQLALGLDRTGQVLGSRVQQSSGSDMLDNAALDALDRAQPPPPIPAGLPVHLDFVVEIDASTASALAAR